jgi:hypothetical protein
MFAKWHNKYIIKMRIWWREGAGKFVDFTVSSCKNKTFDIEGDVKDYVFFMKFVYYVMSLMESFWICWCIAKFILYTLQSYFRFVRILEVNQLGKKAKVLSVTLEWSIVGRFQFVWKIGEKIQGLLSFLYTFVHELCIFM